MLFKEKKVDMTNEQLTTEINKLREEVGSLKAQLSSIYGTESTANQSANQVTTKVNKITDKAGYEFVNFGVKKDEAGIQVSWDTSQFENSLPTGHKLRDVRIVADIDDRTPINSNKKANTVVLSSSVANPQVEVRLKIESNEGIYRYDAVQVLDTTKDGEKVLAVKATIPTEERVLSISEVSDRLMAEIESIKKQIK